ncbi:MAG: GNAT family N-acetyltransferase [Sphingobacteriales bacterium]|nr:MAG: GNAT family N-acetyltransferase [Sphingobacteriales bacterium]TAF81953.1 MAG: GNAT family N-acetyltransferase [Sphingobacteriales bacterium]
MAIKYLKHSSVDKKKWNNCIALSDNGMIYGFSWYLDSICDNWDALVLDDYTAIMPLPWKKKWGIKTIYQPYFCQQLGVFYLGNHDNIVQLFIEKIPFWFFKIAISFNTKCNLEGNYQKRINHILPINMPYLTIAKSYKPDLARYLKKPLPFTFTTSVSVETIIQFYIQFYQQKHPNISLSMYNKLATLCKELALQNKLYIFGILNTEDQLIAFELGAYHHKTVHRILAGTHPDYKKHKLNHHLLDYIIGTHAQKYEYLDFEGSEIENIAYFNKKFNPIETYYSNLSYFNILGYKFHNFSILQQHKKRL